MDFALDMIEDMIGELSAVPIAAHDPADEIPLLSAAMRAIILKHPNVFRFFIFILLFSRMEMSVIKSWNSGFKDMEDLLLQIGRGGIIDVNEIEVVAKTIIYALQGMIMLNLSSNGTASQEDIKEELSRMVHFFFKRNLKQNQGGNII